VLLATVLANEDSTAGLVLAVPIYLRACNVVKEFKRAELRKVPEAILRAASVYTLLLGNGSVGFSGAASDGSGVPPT